MPKARSQIYSVRRSVIVCHHPLFKRILIAMLSKPIDIVITIPINHLKKPLIRSMSFRIFSLSRLRDSISLFSNAIVIVVSGSLNNKFRKSLRSDSILSILAAKEESSIFSLSGSSIPRMLSLSSSCFFQVISAMFQKKISSFC